MTTELRDLSTVFDDSIGWAEDAQTLIAECFMDDEMIPDPLPEAKTAHGKIELAITLLKEAQALMKPLIEEAEIQFWKDDHGDADYPGQHSIR